MILKILIQRNTEREIDRYLFYITTIEIDNLKYIIKPGGNNLIQLFQK